MGEREREGGRARGRENEQVSEGNPFAPTRPYQTDSSCPASSFHTHSVFTPGGG